MNDYRRHLIVYAAKSNNLYGGIENDFIADLARPGIQNNSGVGVGVGVNVLGMRRSGAQ